jgi:hypothetical protein
MLLQLPQRELLFRNLVKEPGLDHNLGRPRRAGGDQNRLSRYFYVRRAQLIRLDRRVLARLMIKANNPAPFCIVSSVVPITLAITRRGRSASDCSNRVDGLVGHLFKQDI